MSSIQFPNMFSNVTTKTVSNHTATLQNLKLLLLSEKGELFGDPYYGTGLKKYLFDQNDVILQDLILDDIYTSIKLFMPQIQVERKDIEVSYDEIGSQKGTLYIKIKALNKADYTTDTYNLVLFENSN